MAYPMHKDQVNKEQVMREIEGLAPDEARAAFRAGLRVPTAGYAAGWVQANLIALPEAFAEDFALFAQRNPQSCPVLEMTKPGAVSGEMFAGDLRTDLPGYRVYRDGELIADPDEVSEYWRDDLVSFLLGCSFTFEAALGAEGIALRHVEEGVNVPMYLTNQSCQPAGTMHGPLVVSMRPIPAERVDDAVRVTARYPAVHGAPVHIGRPEELGIEDLAHPDFGDAVSVRDGEIPVFWACGVTSQVAVMRSRPSFAVTHRPGHMAITDSRDTAYEVVR